MLTARAVQSAGDKSQEPKGICSQRGDTEQWDFFFFSFCTVIKQLAWADILKLLGILITCTSRYTVWAGRNRVSEGSAPTSSFAPLLPVPACCLITSCYCHCCKIIILHLYLGRKDQCGLHCKETLSLLVSSQYAWGLQSMFFSASI